MNAGNAKPMSLLVSFCCRAAKHDGCFWRNGSLRRKLQSALAFQLDWCTSNYRRRFWFLNLKYPLDRPHKAPALDASQRTAAEAESGSHLIEAGPGTGKTRTLIARIDWLLNRGVDPSSILVLTFSNKAAEELRERVAVSAPNAAPAIWAGTFHAFGLEVLRKFGHFQDLGPHVRLVDPRERSAFA